MNIYNFSYFDGGLVYILEKCTKQRDCSQGLNLKFITIASEQRNVSSFSLRTAPQFL